MKRNYLIDIDGTICDDIRNEDFHLMGMAKPIDGSKDLINKWFDEGNCITFFTSRTDDHKEVTEKWLRENGFKYHSIIFNKPRMVGGFSEYVWIDNHITRAVRFKGIWSDLKSYLKSVLIFSEDEV